MDDKNTPGDRLLAMIRPSRSAREVEETGGVAGMAVASTATAAGQHTAVRDADRAALATAPAGPGSFATRNSQDGAAPPAATDTPRAAKRPAERPAAASAANEVPKPRRRFGGRSGKCQVGVDISRSRLICVKTRGQDADCEILATSVTPIPETVEPGSPEFVDILQRTLTGLCGSGAVPKIWAASQDARVNVQFLSIPKVASRQVDNAVFWTAKKEMGLDEGTMLFDFERRGEVNEKGVVRLGALAYIADRDKVRRIREAFAKAGFPLAGFTIEPFAHQTLFRRHKLPSVEGATAVLHVGRHWSRLEIGAKGKLIFVRVIKTSMDGMVEAVQDGLESRGSSPASPVASPAVAASPAAGGVPEVPAESVVDLDEVGFSGTNLVLELDAPLATPAAPEAAPRPDRPRREISLEQAQEALACLVSGCDNLDATHPAHGLHEADILKMLEPVAGRLVRQVEMTLKHFRESLGYEGVTRLAVSGLLGASKVFLDYMGEQLGLSCIALDPVGLYLASGRDVPDIAAPAVLYTQAFGLALSDNAITPNLLFTYRQKAARRTTRATEQWTLVGLAVVLAAMAFFSMDALWTHRQLAAEYANVSHQLARLGGKPQLTVWSDKVAALAKLRQAARTSIVRGRTVAAWGEALSLAPRDVGLGTFTSNFGPPPGANAKEGAKRPAPGPTVGRLVLEGMITGDARLFDSKLASYVVALETSPVFGNATVQKSEVQTLESGGSALHFVIALTLAENGTHAPR